MALEASLLVRYGSSAAADVFCSWRIDGNYGHTFGTLPTEVDTHALIFAVSDNLLL